MSDMDHINLRTTDPGVIVAEIPYSSSKDWEQWVLLRSDAHHDNPKCKQDAEKEHLDEAIERNAGIIDAGDLFCAMQGKYDRRQSKDDLREEHQCGSYLDALVNTAADFYQPYARNWWCFGIGNHETAISKNHETNLTERLTSVLRDRTGATCPMGGYQGWVVFKFESSNKRQSKQLFYAHGSGGGGPVTKGVIQSNRRAACIEGADIVMSGHIHESWVLEIPTAHLSAMYDCRIRTVSHVCCPTYKDEYGPNGYHAENGRPPKPLGAWWLRFYFAKGMVRHELRRAPVL